MAVHPHLREEAHFDGRLLTENLERALQHGGVMFGLVGELSRIIEERRRILINSANFTTPEGISNAVKEQGYIQGLEFVINFILEKANDRPEPRDAESIDEPTEPFHLGANFVTG